MRANAAILALVLAGALGGAGCAGGIRLRESTQRAMAELSALREMARGRAVYLRKSRLPEEFSDRARLTMAYTEGARRTDVLVKLFRSELHVKAPYGTLEASLLDGVAWQAAELLKQFVDQSTPWTTYARDGRLEAKGIDPVSAVAVLEASGEAAGMARRWWLEERDRVEREWRERLAGLPLPNWEDLPRE